MEFRPEGLGQVGERENRLAGERDPDGRLLEWHFQQAVAHEPADHVLRREHNREGDSDGRRRG
jgi:hypothetical protein